MLSRAYNIIFETLANKNRIDVLESLMKDSGTVSQLTKELKLDQTTISHNLRRLKVCGFVNDKRLGKNKVYSANKEAVIPLLNFINNHMNCYCKPLCSCSPKKLNKLLRR